MKKAPRNAVQPSRFHEPLTGTNGEKLLITTSPVISGMTVRRSNGVIAPIVSTIWTRAVRRMP